MPSKDFARTVQKLSRIGGTISFRGTEKRRVLTLELTVDEGGNEGAISFGSSDDKYDVDIKDTFKYILYNVRQCYLNFKKIRLI